MDTNSSLTQSEVILEAALKAIAKHKISDVTMRDIAQSAGISNGALHYYYPSKMELLLSLLDRLDHRFNDPRKKEFAALDLSTANKLRKFFEGQHDFHEQKLTEVFIDFWGQGLKDPIFQIKIQKIYREWRTAIEEVVQEGIDKEEFDPQMVKYIPHLICSTIEGASLQYLIDKDAMDINEYFTFAFNIIFEVLSRTQKVRDPYPSDLTNEQWEKIAALMPEESFVGRPRSANYREIVNAILYATQTGCAWRMLPHDFPHWKTIYGYYNKWSKEKKLDKIGAQLGLDLHQKRESKY